MTGVKTWDDIDDDKCGTDYFDKDHDITADGVMEMSEMTIKLLI